MESYSLRLNTSISNFIARRRQYLEQTKISRLEKTPNDIIAKYRIILDSMYKRMETKTINMLKESKMQFNKQVALLDSYSPLKTMKRGYSVVTKVDNVCIKSIKEVTIGDKLNIKVTDGIINAVVS